MNLNFCPTKLINCRLVRYMKFHDSIRKEKLFAVLRRHHNKALQHTRAREMSAHNASFKVLRMAIVFY